MIGGRQRPAKSRELIVNPPAIAAACDELRAAVLEWRPVSAGCGGSKCPAAHPAGVHFIVTEQRFVARP